MQRAAGVSERIQKFCGHFSRHKKAQKVAKIRKFNRRAFSIFAPFVPFCGHGFIRTAVEVALI
jgi:hypothetical protein